MPLVFVYGALMTHRSSLKSGKAACAKDYSVLFNHVGPNRWEPSFANLERAIGDRAWGVAVSFSNEEWNVIKKKEVGYTEVSIEIKTLEGVSYNCMSLVALDSYKCDEVPPSARYGRTIYRGALIHNLPKEIIDKYYQYYVSGNKTSLKLGLFLRPFFPVGRAITKLKGRTVRK